MLWKSALCGIVFLVLSACSTLTPDEPSFDGTMLMPKMVTSTTATTMTSNGSLPVNDNTTFLEPSSCQALDQKNTELKQDRNRCITDIMTLIDSAYQKYQIAVNDNIGSVNFSLDTFSTIGSVASTATGGATAKVFSAIASVASGSKTALGEDILYKATVQVLLTTMAGNRDKDAAAIKLSMQQDVAAYPIDVAKNDLLKYLNDGTLVAAFASVSQNANATAQACQNANQAVSNAAKSASLSAQTAKDVSTQSSTAAASQTQCNQIAEAFSFQWDASANAANLFRALVSQSGVVNPKAVAALRICVGSVTKPAGLEINNYKNPDGTIDVAQLAEDDKVDSAYKARLLSCVQTALKAAPAR